MRKQEELDHPFLKRQLIAYIGNKRKLLPFLSELFECASRSSGVTTFMDPFCGSGVVARLGRFLGYRVSACDCEEYACVLGRAALEFDRGTADSILGQFGGLSAAIEQLNRVGADAARGAAWGERESNRDVRAGYIARHYAPAHTRGADWRRERLFYTAENAAFIDAVRERIAELSLARGEELLLAPLLYEASVHANTSGVFKAHHKGFGGHGRDALGRILAQAELEVPPLISGQSCSVERSDAIDFCRRTSADIIYLDPPYNQHQYGSNYFMLNTIARWDKPAVSEERDESGRLVERAGIRSDWRETRSDWCRRGGPARRAFENLLEAIDSTDARTVVLSYNTEGIVAFEEIFDLLQERGSVEVRSHDYVQYRGGRQSASRRVRTSELAFILTRRQESRPLHREGSSAQVQSAIRCAALLREQFVPARVSKHFGSASAELSESLPTLRFQDGITIVGEGAFPDLRELQRIPQDELTSLERALSECCVADNEEAIEVILDILDGEGAGSQRPSVLERRALVLLRKLAHPGYRDAYDRLFHRFCSDTARATRHSRALAALEQSVAARG